jgi:hypothetical protein
MLTPGYTIDTKAIPTQVFHTLERRVPSRGALFSFQSER